MESTVTHQIHALPAEVQPEHPAMEWTVGIVGLGSFGRFMASVLQDKVQVMGYDPGPSLPELPQLERVELEAAASADVAILAVPLDTLGSALQGIRQVLHPDTLVVDVCSVKTRPEQLVAQHLPDHQNVLLTHPLFGPQSAADGTEGHKLVVTKSVGDRAVKAIDFCRDSLGLEIREMSAAAHALTLFVARGLADMGLDDRAHPDITPPSFEEILDVMELDGQHSDEVFRTIQLGNPHAHEVRRQLLDSLTHVDEELTAQTGSV
ncbi:MAG TPA: prephenate dehydrogenase/arogenate dehydrogenase family protein [Candidatus Limnocylindria bacterium]|nr:prephenate dehydrogenase/arogenate dehydrogenase family protein [Candidatus Limnocylindria bacterium]